MTEATGVVRESRRIEAPATVIFQVLVDPARHVDIDGSEMVRGALTQRPITGVGDRFDMAMFSKYFGEYTMQNHVVEFEPDRRVAWAPAPGDDRSGGRPVGNPPGHLWRFELAPDGEGSTVVTHTYDCTAAPDDIRAAVREGELWRPGMERTLDRLAEACTPRLTR